MAYIPLHKRHSDDKGRPLTPELLAPEFKRNLNLRSLKSDTDRSGIKTAYEKCGKYRWLAVGLDDDDQFPSDTHLEPISLGLFESVMSKGGEKPLVLVNDHLAENISKPMRNLLRNPWTIVAENMLQDLISSFEVQRHESDVENPTLVAIFGKILFRGNPSVRLGTDKKNQVTESLLNQLTKSIYTNIPSSYMEYIIDGVVPDIGVDFEEEKDIYRVMLSDSTRPYTTVSHKCSVTEDKKLQLYKLELNHGHHLVTDVSCLDKNLDVRLMLMSRVILKNPTDDKMSSISSIINSAVVDSQVKGRLRWPLGKQSSGDRYSVVGVWHVVAKAYTSPSVGLTVRHVHRFDFKNGNGEASREIYLELKGIFSELQEQKADEISHRLEDSLKLIWTYLLRCGRFLT